MPPAGHPLSRKADPKGWLVHQKRRWVLQSAARKKARLAADKAAVLAARRGGAAASGVYGNSGRRLQLRRNGMPFTAANVKSLCGAAPSNSY